MLLSKKWLNDFVDTSKKKDQEIADLITGSTVEVEGIVDQAASLEGMIVGLVKKLNKHPNADKLTLCDVDLGGRTTQIVCGGENLREGMKVAVALPGSKVRWHGEGELIELTQTKIRGEESEGMICASAEIGLTNSAEGEKDILDLGEIDAKPGDALSVALMMDDIVFEVEHKSLTNRPDLFGHYGMAREIAVLTKTELKPYTRKQIMEGSGITIDVTVENQALCPRYMAVAMEGVEVKPSPLWMQNRLRACGIRPINNIVDITNFVLLETGEPMHAFDAELLGGDTVNIGVRTAKKGEKIVCLDEEKYVLEKEMLLITDAKNPVAIAGVMGGEHSGVTENTKRIVFEAANFEPVSIRKTSQKLSLRSESSARFEKSLDPELCEFALQRAVELVLELCPAAKVCSNVVDERSEKKEAIILSFTSLRLNSYLGLEATDAEIKEILERLGFGVLVDAGTFEITVPSWRATKDIEIAEDLFEEVARIYGYDKITSTLPSFVIDPPTIESVRPFVRKARAVLSKQGGANEVYQYAFVGPRTIDVLGFDSDNHLKLLNPLASDRPYLVQSLIPNLLEAAMQNQRTYGVIRLFQVERVFKKNEKGLETGMGKAVLPNQPMMLAGVCVEKGNTEPFWQAKELLVQYLDSLGFEFDLVPAKKPAPWQHAVRQADIVIDGEIVGVLSEIDPARAEALGLDHRASAFEINLDALSEFSKPEMCYKPVSVFPSSVRDLAFIVDGTVACLDIKAVLEEASSLLINLEVFDVYCGKGVEEGKKSVALHLSFNAGDRTLSSEEVDEEIEKVAQVLEAKLSATIRV
jgi:phenylalanyl-tRNA synthetase beta chain